MAAFGADQVIPAFGQTARADGLSAEHWQAILKTLPASADVARVRCVIAFAIENFRLNRIRPGERDDWTAAGKLSAKLDEVICKLPRLTEAQRTAVLGIKERSALEVIWLAGVRQATVEDRFYRMILHAWVMMLEQAPAHSTTGDLVRFFRATVVPVTGKPLSGSAIKKIVEKEFPASG